MLTTIEKNESNKKNGDLLRINKVDELERKKQDAINQLINPLSEKEIKELRRKMKQEELEHKHKIILIFCVIVLIIIILNIIL